jgi:hypothetical protein
MTEEHRDPELDSIRAEWEAPPPSAGFHARLLGAYESERGASAYVVRWWRRWPVAAAVTAAGVFLAMVILRPHGEARFEPVSQPHFIILSAGEHP